MSDGDGAAGGVAMLLMVLAVVAVVGIFAYFMANNQQPSTVIQAPPAPQISIPTPAKPDAQ
jgi:flagellar basal body-associated protein FliL